MNNLNEDTSVSISTFYIYKHKGKDLCKRPIRQFIRNTFSVLKNSIILGLEI